MERWRRGTSPVSDRLGIPFETTGVTFHPSGLPAPLFRLGSEMCRRGVAMFEWGCVRARALSLAEGD